jgi:hypothetical protein
MNKATGVELYDTGTFLHLKGYESFDMGRMADPDHQFNISGSDLVKIAKIFGVDSEEHYPVGTPHQTPEGKIRQRQARDVSIPIFVPLLEPVEVEDLVIDIDGNRLDINVEWEGGSKNRFSYSGRYFIHWQEDES